MPTPEPIDLHHLGRERIIASYLLDTDDGPALFDCGPSTTIDALKAGLADRGLALTDVRHLLLSHIHLDHAGAAGVLVREHPALQVHVSPIGAPHLVDPARLEKSARRLYGDTFDSLWGELAPVPQENVHTVEDRVLGLDCFPTPGHASHHVCYLDPDGTLYAGDACGVRVLPGRFVMPPTPPPEVDVEAWEETLDEIEHRAPERLALDPLRRRRRRRAPPHRAAAQPARLGGVGRGRRDGGGVRRVRARPAHRLARGRADLRPRDAALAVLPRSRALGREAGRSLAERRLTRQHPGRDRPASPPRVPSALRGAGDLVRRDVPRADRGRVRDPRQRRRRDRGRAQLRRLDARAGGDARLRRRPRRPAAAARGHGRLRCR